LGKPRNVQVDARFFSPAAATATAPAGIFATTLPSGGATVDIDGLIGAVGVVEAAGGVPNAIFLSPADVTKIRQSVVHPSRHAVAREQGVFAEVHRSVATDRQDDVSRVGHEHFAGVERGRRTMRVDWGVGDPAAFAVIGTPT
jgi:hypothetical protein